MDLLELILSLNMPMDRGQFTGDYSFDISPTFAGHVPQLGDTAVSLPGMVLHGSGLNSHEASHELTHGEQQRALGPAFWAAYALTGGREFESYDPLRHSFIPQAGPIQPGDPEIMWRPPPEMQESFPLFRVARDGDQTRVQFLPGYPELLRIHGTAPSPSISKALQGKKTH